MKNINLINHLHHIIPLLKSLQFVHKIKLKCFTTYKILLNLAPAYPSNLLPFKALSYSLCSNHNDLLSTPPKHTHSVPASGPLLLLCPLPGTLLDQLCILLRLQLKVTSSQNPFLTCNLSNTSNMFYCLHRKHRYLKLSCSCLYQVVHCASPTQI